MSPLEVGPPGGGEGPSRPSSRPRARGLALLLGALAGLASWAIGEAVHARYAPPKLVNTAAPTGGFVSNDEIQRLGSSKMSAQLFEAALTFGSLGAALGLGLGLAGGLTRGSGGAPGRSAITGLVLAGLTGVAAADLLLPVYYRVVNPDTNELVVGVLNQAAISALIGFAAGAAFGLGLGQRSQAIHAASGGALGAIAGALAYEVGGALAFPLDETSAPISATAMTRLFARLAVCILAAAGAAMVAVDRKEPTIPSPEGQMRQPAPEPVEASGLEA